MSSMIVYGESAPYGEKKVIVEHRICRINYTVKHPSYIEAHGTVFDQLAKLENQEIENDDPPVFVTDASLHLFL